MGFFVNTPSLVPAVTKALRGALLTNPNTVPDPQETARTQAVAIASQVSGTVAWPRVICALLALAAVLGAAIYTGQKPELKDLYQVLVHSFEILFGGMVGLIVGEAASR